MEQRHQRSLWEDTTEPTRYEPLLGDIRADVAIVGAGITGLTAAYLLKQAGMNVAVVEARHIGAGTTGRTTAHLTAEYDYDYYLLQQAHGDDTCRLVATSMLDAITLVQRLVRELAIDCGFRRLPGYYFADREQGIETIEREYETIKRLELYPVEMVEHVPLPFPTRRGYQVADQAQMHPMTYLLALATAVQGGGSRVFEHTRVTDYSGGPTPSITTPRGNVEADQLIMATHTPIGRSVLHALVAPYRSYVLGFTTSSGAAPDGLFWDTEEPYHFVRQQPTDRGPMVLVGGADTKTGHGGEMQAFAALEAYTRERFDVDQVHYRWSAQYFEPADHLPSIGRLPAARDIYVGTGYSGDGMTFGSLAGAMLAEQVLGHETPYDALYRPARLRMLRGRKQLLKENLDVARRFVGDRLGRSVRRAALEQLGHETGAVLTIEGERIAAVRDETGELKLFDPVCPHLHCIVHWNAAQKTFDCPCHGSRFDSDGQVLEGPALSGLLRLDGGELRRR